jgi:hypothetical protein
MRFSRFFTLLCVVSIPAFSQTALSGNTGGLTLEATGNPYLGTGIIIFDGNHHTAQSAKLTADPILGAFNGITISLIL